MQVEDIHHEMPLNIGTSVKDAVIRIEKIVTPLSADVQFLLNSDARGYSKMDINKACTTITEKCAEICGKDVSSLTARKWMSLIHYDDRAELTENWNIAYENRSPFFSHKSASIIDTVTKEIRYIKVEGTPGYVAEQFDGFDGTVKLLKTENGIK